MFLSDFILAAIDARTPLETVIKHPIVIQGGMGAGVSGWRLARRVSRLGHLGVVAGTALDTILARRLQQGDPDGHLRRALQAFPVPEIANRVLQRYFVAAGKPVDEAFKLIPLYTLRPARELLELTVVANFVEIFLAKEGHDGVVGVNYLEKIQLPNLASLYGAMLAGVDYVLMGAGIPREIPGILDSFVDHAETSLRINVTDDGNDDFRMQFDPAKVIGTIDGQLERPQFLAIVSSVTLAMALKKRATGDVNGFIIEGPAAGGHNAPPRGHMTLDENGEPIYAGKDEVDLRKIAKLGLPYWLAGSYGHPERLAEALEQGATGVQIGTPFAFCEESGFTDEIKREVLDGVRNKTLEVFTDPLASPTGFPFKLVRLGNTLSTEEAYAERLRGCDLGYLRTAFKRDDGKVGYRCPAELACAYETKGGAREDTTGRRCLCNGLLANIGLEQTRPDGYVEKPMVTSGSDLSVLEPFVSNGRRTYSAADVIARVAGLPAAVAT